MLWKTISSSILGFQQWLFFLLSHIMVYVSKKDSFPPEQTPETMCGCGKISFIGKNAVSVSLIRHPLTLEENFKALCQRLYLPQLVNPCKKLWREMLLYFAFPIWGYLDLQKESNWLSQGWSPAGLTLQLSFLSALLSVCGFPVHMSHGELLGHTEESLPIHNGLSFVSHPKVHLIYLPLVFWFWYSTVLVEREPERVIGTINMWHWNIC